MESIYMSFMWLLHPMSITFLISDKTVDFLLQDGSDLAIVLVNSLIISA